MIIKQRYQILKGYESNHVTIGFGSYGQVKLARDITTGIIVAMKMHKIAKNQVMMHWTLTHPKIIKLIDVHIDTERQITYMILEYAEDGTLYQKIKSGNLTNKEAKKYFLDVCEGLAYLHSQKIMHRDIKPQNVLLTKKGEAKLCDFGFAALVGQRKTLCGTYEYMSPEMIQNKNYDYKIDIWALGILYFELIAGHAPFRGSTAEEVLEKMKTKIYFCEKFEAQDIDLIKSILRVSPQKRPSVQDIIQQLLDKNQSVLSTNDSINPTNLQFLTKSWSPKKMPDLIKIIGNETQKKTFPPFIPKFQEKIPGISSSFHVVSPEKLPPAENTPKCPNSLQTIPNVNLFKISPTNKVVSCANFVGLASSLKTVMPMKRDRPTSYHIQSIKQTKNTGQNAGEPTNQE